MGRVKLTLAYEGTAFSGWQLQPNARSVQGVLERALSGITGEPVRVHGSGRTDAGVHALGQVAHFDAPERFAHIPWQKALNQNLPDDVRVLEACLVPGDFHARYSALSKTYAYNLWLDRDRLLPQRRRYVWACGAVDVVAMDQAASVLLGEHDFAAFQNTGTVVKSTQREVTAIEPSAGALPQELVWRFTATGFLRQMVRNMMGCLVQVGRGKVTVDEVRAILQGGDRTQAPPCAPPQGLTLERVEYPAKVRPKPVV